ncbi:hypothetical protein A2572_01820 [Candidatus Collierbacteria bacterium RIFOXYD1_FULL_40_9]|uniref:Uncharacterized protein n=1 Tax=Candidatus Collierbacteria bacterium RIFOXYD1_FULL_40_9 TaxID=1817731 RepID=A0A1F5FUY7_9BACT|nr:MAG: hypothetical protein A2572_01820 [Candidatus Collierbacteria bacterium RIFOXYD1_FULL_40_9]
MSTVTIIDPFERNKKKLAIINQIIQVVGEYFPNHQICHPSHYRGSTNYYPGEPITEKTLNNIVSAEFAIAKPNKIDTRKRILWVTVGEEEKPEVIGQINLRFKESEEDAVSITIKVFGLENKDIFLKFSNEFVEGKLKHVSGLKYLKVESENPKYLS